MVIVYVQDNNLDIEMHFLCFSYGVSFLVNVMPCRKRTKNEILKFFCFL